MKIAQTPDRVLKVASTYDLEEETITEIEGMIEEGPIVSTTQGNSFNRPNFWGLRFTNTKIPYIKYITEMICRAVSTNQFAK